MGTLVNRPIGSMNMVEFFFWWFILALIVMAVIWLLGKLKTPANKQLKFASPFYTSYDNGAGNGANSLVKAARARARAAALMGSPDF